MSVRITKDHSADVLKAISLMGKSRILIGIPESEDSRKDGAPIGNAAIAYINDNGSPKLNIPARPFLRPGVEDSLPRVLAALRVAGGVCALVLFALGARFQLGSGSRHPKDEPSDSK